MSEHRWNEASAGEGDSPAEEGALPEEERLNASGEAPGEEATEAGPPAGDEGETLDRLIEEDLGRLAAERDEYLDSLRRLQADFDNYRKRAVRQQTDLLERASENLLIALLPVLDALDLAEAHVGAGDDQAALGQIGTLLRETLSREGLERIDAVGVAFDPTVHDAVAHEEADEAAEGGQQIAEVMRAGYRLKGRVVRPAMVKVKG
ncbi:MAG TPA: nucleotide exchange factor GrpE [Acidimicrobiales bacterium]|nr:nucleotide exchange factor GrpE [Acidimicrobiales bacterium]